MKRPDGVRPGPPARPASGAGASDGGAGRRGSDEATTEPIRIVPPAAGGREGSRPRPAAAEKPRRGPAPRPAAAEETGPEHASRRGTGSDRHSAPDEGGTETADGGPRTPRSTGASSSVLAATLAARTATAHDVVARIGLLGAERRNVARTARDRRRYERGEVRRFTRRARRRRAIVLSVLGSLLALAVVVGVAAYSPLMAVRTIEITGTQRVDAGALQGALDDQLGVPLTLVDRRAIGRVLGGYPLVQSYSVQTRPPGTLVVSVVERTPIGVLETGGRFELVDAAGVVVETVDAAPAGYPVLTTSTGGASGAGFRATAQVLRTLPASLEGRVASATATTGDDVSLTLVGGTVVVWGGPGDSALKAVVLDKLMAATDPATVASYDVSSPQSAVVAPR